MVMQFRRREPVYSKVDNNTTATQRCSFDYMYPQPHGAAYAGELTLRCAGQTA